VLPSHLMLQEMVHLRFLLLQLIVLQIAYKGFNLPLAQVFSVG
jgi:hypothetical protein